MTALVAAFGNIFFSDDGFGSAVARKLADVDLGDNVRVRDFGTGGMYLALEMLVGYDTVVIIDAVNRPDPPGSVFAIDCTDECRIEDAAPDAHAMSLGAVFDLYARLRDQSGTSRKPNIIVVGCVPQNLTEGMELSEPVSAAISPCIDFVRKLTRDTVITGAQT